MSVEDEIRQASDRYYRALNHLINGDSGPMMEVWSHSPDVTTMNPYGGREVGWEQVRSVFEKVAQACVGNHLTLRMTDPLIRVSGDLAYEIGLESGEGTVAAGQQVSPQHRVTNIYRREADGWKNIHRHSDIDINEAEKEVAKRLQSLLG